MKPIPTDLYLPPMMAADEGGTDRLIAAAHAWHTPAKAGLQHGRWPGALCPFPRPVQERALPWPGPIVKDASGLEEPAVPGPIQEQPPARQVVVRPLPHRITRTECDPDEERVRRVSHHALIG